MVRTGLSDGILWGVSEWSIMHSKAFMVAEGLMTAGYTWSDKVMHSLKASA